MSRSFLRVTRERAAPTNQFICGLLLLACIWSVRPVSAQPGTVRQASDANAESVPEISSDEPSLKVGFRINDYYQTEMDLYDFESGQEVALSAKRFFESTGQLLITSVQDRLRERIHNGKLTLNTLREEGLHVDFRRENLQVDLMIPPQMRQISTTDFRGGRPESKEGVLVPGPFSGYTNIEASKIFGNRHLIADESPSLYPLEINLANVWNLNSWVLETGFDYREYARHPWVREEFSLSKDFPEKTTRLVLGDVVTPLEGFQTSFPLGGVWYGTQRSISPHRSFTPTLERDFFLENASEVDVYINGLLYRTLNLQAGPHSLENLPVDRGANDVQLVVRDPHGRVQTLDWTFVSDFELLEQGISEYSLGLGVQRTWIERTIDYDTRHLLASGFMQYGLLKNLTGGLNGQVTRDQSLVGTDLVIGTSFGLFGIDSARSEQLGLVDWASRFRFRTLGRAGWVYRLQWGWRGAHFSPVGLTGGANAYSHTLDSSVSVDLEKLFVVNFGGAYDWGRGSTADRKRTYVRLSKTIRRGLILSGQWTRQDTGIGDPLSYFSFYLQWVDSGYDHQITSSYQTRSETFQSEWQYNPGRELDQPEATLAWENGEDSETQRARFGYLGRRMFFSGAHQKTVYDRDIGSQSSENTRLHLSTALAYAGNRWAVTRPIYDSFVLVDADPDLREEVLEVNSIAGLPVALVDEWGPGVLPEVGSYMTSRVVVQTRDPIASSMLEETSYRVHPTYKSGVLVPVRGDRSIMLSGRVLAPPGVTSKEIHLQTGTLTNTTKQDEVYEFFTNREGEFYIDRILPGRYLLKLHGDQFQAELEIPEMRRGLFEIGDVALKRSE